MKKTNVLSIMLMGLLIASCNQSEIDQPTENVTKASNVNDKLSSLYTSNFTGEGTFYSPTGLGNCSEEYPSNGMYAAMNKSQYNNSNACGSYVEITRKGTTKKVVVKILDQCPECPSGNIDLSKTAFLKLGTVAEGRIPITWKYIPQPGKAKIAVRIKEGSSRYYFAIQIRNHRYMVSKLEIKNAKGVYVNAARQSYNYFLDTDGVFDGKGPDGPYDIRITDVSGNVVTTKINFEIAKVLATSVQFPVTN
jgi:expansin